MPVRLFQLYQRKRVININVNITLASLLAIWITMIPVQMLEHKLTQEWMKYVIPPALELVVDFLIYFVLHWVANHWKPIAPKTEAERKHHEADRPSYIKDTVVVQAERAALSPVFYAIGVGGQFVLHEQLGWSTAVSYAVAYSVGLMVTRTMHTVWGMKSGTMRDHDDPKRVAQLRCRRLRCKRKAALKDDCNRAEGK